MKRSTARSAALHALSQTIVDGRFLDTSLDSALESIVEPRERALARELAYGVCRFWFQLSSWRDRLLQRPLKEKDADVGILINLGLYQLAHSRIPAHAAVAETVQLATSALRKRWANALVNAVLRRFIRERDAVSNAADEAAEALWSHPQWLIASVREAWPEHWQAILRANNEHAPMTLRANRQRAPRRDAMDQLATHAIGSSACAWCEDGFVLDAPRDVSALPGFAEGQFSVQDEAAQLAASLLDVQAGHSFLDACAAPGGKFAHVLETTADIGHALALDRDPGRARRITQTLQRLGLHGTVRTADAAVPVQWWDETPFDRILLDAPCSATGVIRRHPDIKLHREASDIASLAQTQFELLEALWPLLAAGGRLLYATCSIIPAENTAPVNRFLRKHTDAHAVDLDVDWGVCAQPGRQILPGDDGMDGFYYALLAKQ